MRKVLSIILTLLSITTIVGCNIPKDTSIYTSKNPYVIENADLSDEQSLHLAYSNYFQWKVGSPLGPEKISYWLWMRVKKVSSKHYYWENDKEKMYYTITTLEILETISGEESHYKSYNVGDEIRVLEYYSFAPNGVFCHGENFVYHNDFDDSMAPLSTNHVLELPQSDWDIYLSPFIKSDTEYIIALGNDIIINNEQQYVQLYMRKSKIPYEHIKGTYCYKSRLVEFSEEAYIYAKSQLPGYDDPDSDIDWSEKNRYFQEVIYLWEKYGKADLE